MVYRGEYPRGHHRPGNLCKGAEPAQTGYPHRSQSQTALPVQWFFEMCRLWPGDVPDRIQRDLCILSMRDL